MDAVVCNCNCNWVSGMYDWMDRGGVGMVWI